MSRLPQNPESASSDNSFMKIGLQVKPDLHEKLKAVAFIEKRQMRYVLSDAIDLYLEKKHPDLDEKMKVLND